MNEALLSQVLDLGRRRADAESRGDADALEAVLADDFLLVGPLGFVLDKQQYLGSRRSGDLKHDSFAWEDVRIRLYGAMAVVIGSQTKRSTYHGRDTSGQFRVTQSAGCLDGRWKLVGLHLSRSRSPTSR
jgi:hypothetical protein